MKVIVHEFTCPSFNLAVEEYLLKQTDDEYFMLWRNDRSIIVGRNQNTHAEINEEFVRENGIAVIRRLTGGGAVFHDLGNLNYTFITRGGGHFNDYSFFAAPVLETLSDIGVNACLSGRNDLLIDGKKFSGNAQCAYKNGVMHHGTLMFNADVYDMTNALKVNPLKIKSKGIASVRSRVTNISEYLKEPLTLPEFTQKLKDKILKLYPTAELYEFTKEDIAAVKKLQTEKYGTYDWNFGFRQEYTVSKEARFNIGTVNVCLNIKNNAIEKIKIFGDFFGTREIAPLEEKLLGAAYTPKGILSALKDEPVGEYIFGITAQELVNLML